MDGLSIITDCRGLGKLITQIANKSESGISIEDIKKHLSERIMEVRGQEELSEERELTIQYGASADAFQYVLDFINGNN